VPLLDGRQTRSKNCDGINAAFRLVVAVHSLSSKRSCRRRLGLLFTQNSLHASQRRDVIDDCTGTGYKYKTQSEK